MARRSSSFMNSLRKSLGHLKRPRSARRKIGFFESLEDRRTLSVSTSLLDINPNGSSFAGSYYSSSIGIFFSALAADTGQELYITDGTSTGTRLVRDIRVGANSSNPSEFVEMDGIVYFTAYTDAYGYELWRTDGTSFGTYLVADIRPGAMSGIQGSKCVVNGTLYLSADSGSTGLELWKSDGTASGTVLVKDIQAGAVGSVPSGMINLNGTLIFSAFTSASGRELWRSDGTDAGTFQIADINPGAANSDVAQPILSGAFVYFFAINSATGRELYRTDGTGAGTLLLGDIYPGSGSGGMSGYGDVAGTFYFGATDIDHGWELWKTTGTPASTVLVADINPGTEGSFPGSLIAATGSKFYFSAYTPATGTELWTSSGTAATTSLVSDTAPGTASGNLLGAAYINNILYFTAFTPATGWEVFQSLGTQATTTLLVDLVPGADSSNPYGYLVVNETLVLSATSLVLGIEPVFLNTRPTVLIDNNRSGYTENGLWSTSVVKGYNNTTSRFSNQTTAVAAWSAQSLTPGYYKVEFYKIVVSNSSPAVDIKVFSADGTKTFRTSQAGGGPSGWADLGIYRFSGTLGQKIVLSNAATSGVLRADAVRFIPVSAPVSLDFGSQGYSESGTWATNTTIKGNANSTTRESNTANASVTYAPVLIAGQYTVQIFIVVNANSTTSAQVTLASNSGLSTYLFNQTTGTSGWVTLGTFNFDGVGDEYVRLRNLSAGFLRADAVRFFKR